MNRCICLDNLPVIGGRIKPNPACPKHKTVAARWKEIKTWQAMYDALAADDPTMPSFDEWRKTAL